MHQIYYSFAVEGTFQFLFAKRKSWVGKIEFGKFSKFGGGSSNFDARKNDNCSLVENLILYDFNSFFLI